MNKKRKIERLEKQKIARREKYAEIKQDPVLYELVKEKEKLRYQERKKKKQIKSVHEESSRDQREKRKKWREASKKYRLEKKNKLKKQPVISEVVLVKAPDNDNDEIEAGTENPLEISIKNIYEFKNKKNTIFGIQ